MNEPIIHDSTPSHVLFPPGEGTGLDLSGRPQGFAYAGTADPFPTELLIPRSEWQARIQEREETKTRLSDLCDRRGVKVKDQQQTNYCWCNAPTHCVEIVRAIQNQRTISLSAASVGAQLTNYRNVGGWGKEALQFIASNGVVPDRLWPVNAISRQYATQEAKDEAKRFAVDEWWEIEPRNLDQLISCLLQPIASPVAVGLSWWGHEVTYVDAVWLDGEVAVRFDNSWGERYGTKGRGIIQGSRILPDDAVSPRLTKAYN